MVRNELKRTMLNLYMGGDGVRSTLKLLVLTNNKYNCPSVSTLLLWDQLT